MTPDPNLHPIVKIIWIDAVTHEGWQDSPNDLDLESVASVGYLLSCNNDTARIAGTVNLANTLFGDITVIPRSQVKSIHILGEA